MTDEARVNEAVNGISKEFGGIDILLCFAGITDSKLAVDYPIEQWRRIFDVNVHGSFLVARAVARFVIHNCRLVPDYPCCSAAYAYADKPIEISFPAVLRAP